MSKIVYISPRDFEELREQDLSLVRDVVVSNLVHDGEFLFEDEYHLRLAIHELRQEISRSIWSVIKLADRLLNK